MKWCAAILAAEKQAQLDSDARALFLDQLAGGGERWQSSLKNALRSGKILAGCASGVILTGAP